MSLSGYFEPKGDDMDDDMFGYGQEEEEGDEGVEDGDDDSSDEEEEVSAAPAKAAGAPRKVDAKAL